MPRIDTMLVTAFDLRLLPIVVVICLFATLNVMGTIGRGLLAEGRWRLRWLALAGLVTAVGSWATHVAAMLAYAPKTTISLDLATTAWAALFGIVGCSIGWIIGFGPDRYRLPAGALIVTLALAGMHNFNMTAFVAAGSKTYDVALILASLVAGFTFCLLSTWLIKRSPDDMIQIKPGAALCVAMLVIHLVGIAAEPIAPAATAPAGGYVLNSGALQLLVGAACIFLLLIGGIVAHADFRFAAGHVADKQRLEELVAALRASEERYRLASSATIDVISDWSVDTGMVAWGENIGTIFGYEEAKNGTSSSWWLERVHPDDREEVSANLAGHLTCELDTVRVEYRFRRADGTYADIRSYGCLVRDESGRVVRIVGAMHDISDRKRNESRLVWAANHDALTGLPNRTLFGSRLEEALDEAAAKNACVSLIVIDVDQFKQLNDTRGHAAGDVLLMELASRLLRNLPANATAARLGGDEFAVILPGVGSDPVSAETAHRLLTDVSESFFVDGRMAEVSISAGWAIWPNDGRDADDLLKGADLALYAAKGDGRATVRSFHPEMRAGLERRSSMLTQARLALNEERVVAFYQPKVDLQTGTVEGFEALLRWHNGKHGLQAPASISAAFEDRELAGRLTDEIIGRVAADMRTWLDRGIAFGRIAINGSPADFLRGDLADRLLESLHRARIDPCRLELEVTETVLVGKTADNVAKILATLSNAGVTIALDDFGTGYASLTHLKQFPVDVLKIDRTFVSRLTGQSDADDAAIVGAVIDLARNLGIATVAEGIETQHQAWFLAEKGCNFGQGFLFSPAVPAAQAPAIVRSGFAHTVAPRRSASVTQLRRVTG